MAQVSVPEKEHMTLAMDMSPTPLRPSYDECDHESETAPPGTAFVASSPLLLTTHDSRQWSPPASLFAQIRS